MNQASPQWGVGGQRGRLMLKAFVQAYTRGYREGLCLRGLSSFLSTDSENHSTARGVSAAQKSRPAYQGGFREGLKDSAMILRVLQTPLDQILL
jgi:hypothetical protein